MKSGLNNSVTQLENTRQRRMNRIRRQRAIEAGKPVDVSLKSMALNSAQQKDLSNLQLRPHVNLRHQTATPNRVSIVVALGIHLIAVLLGAIYIVSPTRLDAEATIVDIVRSGRTDSRSVRQGICNIGEYLFPRDGCLIPNPRPSKLWTPTPGYEKIRRDASKPLLEVTTPLFWLKKIEPEYPSEAKRAGKEGKVVLEATIDVDGKAKDIVIKEDNVGFGCARAAIDALEASLFRPAKRGAASVPIRIVIPYQFKLED
jgi:TonB family protein